MNNHDQSHNKALKADVFQPSFNWALDFLISLSLIEYSF